MITPIVFSTILISNYSLKRFNVPREFITISTSQYKIRKESEEYIEQICSPRITKDGSKFYLSNGIVSWINCNTALCGLFEEPLVDWQDEISLMEQCGLKFGQDIIRLELSLYGVYCVNGSGLSIDCEWEIKTLDFSYEFSEALLWINPHKLFRGYSSIVGWK